MQHTTIRRGCNSSFSEAPAAVAIAHNRDNESPVARLRRRLPHNAPRLEHAPRPALASHHRPTSPYGRTTDVERLCDVGRAHALNFQFPHFGRIN